jgi:thiol-disulfide isomerase/thioredoxin
MVKIFCSVFILITLSSCGYRTLEGRVKPVYFSADDAVFNDSLFSRPRLLYQNVLRLAFPCVEVIDLQRGKEVKLYIKSPTLFNIANKPFLVYPKEHIFVTSNATKDDFTPTFSTLNKDNIRDGELEVLKNFIQLERGPQMLPFTGTSLPAILNAEREINNSIGARESASQQLFDSLCTAYHVSENFRRLTKNYIHNRYDFSVLGLYVENKDTLLAYHLYDKKLRQKLEQLNQFKKTNQFNRNVEDATNSLYTLLFPYNGIRNMATRGGFKMCFDTVASNFRGPARDYLLSRLMYRTLTLDARIPSGYYKLYRSYSMNKDYRKIIARANREQKRNKLPDNPTCPTILSAMDGKKVVKLDDVLSQYKGKYVLVDFWASWCVPCIKEMPALETLKQRYPADKIAFVSVSLDSDVEAWVNRVSQLHIDSLSSYLLLEKEKSSIVKEIGLDAVPRYVLFDKDGKMINADAPFPRQPGLKELLDILVK